MRAVSPKRWIEACVALALLVGASGCATPEPAPVFSSIRFDQSANYRLDVAAVTIVERFQPPRAAPNADHEAPIPPIEVLGDWARQRFIAIGTRDTLRVTIIDAAITEVPLAVDQDIEAKFTTERAARFDARVAVLLEVVDLSGQVPAETEAEVSRSRTLAEDATEGDRDRLLHELTRDLAHDLDETIAPGVQRYFAAYLR